MRREKLFTGLGDFKNLTAVEIGALDQPFLTKDEIQVSYVDFTDTQTLKEKYASFPDRNADNIVEVDAIWGDQSLSEAFGADFKADLVLASHVIEHVPDLITWLDEIVSILKPDGTVHLAIPDRRYCFDVRRRESTLSDVLYSYIMRARKPLPHQVLDFGLNYMTVDCGEVWSGIAQIPDQIASEQVEHGIGVAKTVMETGEYFDVHCWVFTPLTFARLMQQLAAIGMVELSCKHWYDTAQNELEFFVIMQKSDDKEANVRSWNEMAHAIESADAAYQLNDRSTEATEAADEAAGRQEWLSKVAAIFIDNPSWWSVMLPSWRRRRKRQYLRESGLFDVDAYLKLYPDVAAGGMDPLRHYLLHGMAEGRILPR